MTTATDPRDSVEIRPLQTLDAPVIAEAFAGTGRNAAVNRGPVADTELMLTYPTEEADCCVRLPQPGYWHRVP